MYIRKGKYYQFDHSIDSIEQLEQFALEGYEKTKLVGDIPKLP
jgi:hypothetical protein